MWLVIDKATQRVFAIETAQPPEDAYPTALYDVKEWDGPVPKLEMPAIPPNPGRKADLDPTLADPGYQDKVQQRLDFEALADKATAEIEWLDETIPNIQTMTGAEVRDVVHRLAREQREELRAWRYIFRRLA